MKHLCILSALLLATLSTTALADSPEAILKDYRKQAAKAVERLNQSLEKTATPMITKLVSSGDTAGAELLTAQLKDKLAGNPVPTPQASAVQLFSLYDEACSKALAPIKKASVARIESMLHTAGGAKLDTVAELGKVREEIESGNAALASASSADAPKTGAGVSKKVADLVKSLGGEYIESSGGNEVKFNRANLSSADLLQIGADKSLKSFIWTSGSGLNDEGMAAFEGMKNLQHLFLWSKGNITDEGLKHLGSCEKLEVLNIGSNGAGVTGAGFESLAQCKSLRELTLNLLTGVDGKNLRYLTRLKSFEVLLLSACKGVKDEDLEWVGQMKSLNRLHLGNTSVTDAGLAKLAGLRQLKELTVSAPLVTPAGVQPLTKARPGLAVIFTK